jgi:uncharacterized membrane protein YtjA (UPF0391 family)
MPGNLIYYALVVIDFALVAALLGFGGLVSTAMGGAHLLFWAATVVILICLRFLFSNWSANASSPPNPRAEACRGRLREGDATCERIVNDTPEESSLGAGR